MRSEAAGRIFTCDRCGAATWDGWPHPDGEPCPVIVRDEERREAEHRAYMEKVAVETAAAQVALQANNAALDAHQTAGRRRR